MASIRPRARCDECRRLLTLVSSRHTLLLPVHNCPADDSRRYSRVYWQATVKWDGTRHSHSARTRAAAAEWARQLEDDLAAGITAEDPVEIPTLAEWEARWWAGRVNEPTTMTNDKQKIRTHILPTWGQHQLDDISPMDYQSWIAGIDRAPDTVRKIHSLMSQMLAAAVREKLIESNPCAGADLPPLPPGREVYLDRPEVDAIAAAMNVRPYPAVTIVLAYTGLRWGELAGLQKGSVDFSGDRLYVVRTMTSEGPKEYPKSRQRRTIRLPGRAREALLAHLAEEEARRGPLGDGALVFVGRRGLPLNGRHYSRRVFAGALKAARVDGKPIRKKAVPHDLRHTCASWLVQAGVPIYDVMVWLGHTDLKSTMRYAHLASGHDRALAALDGDVVPPVVPPGDRERRKPSGSGAKKRQVKRAARV